MYDVTNENSFLDVSKWRLAFLEQQAEKEQTETFPFLLIGNKTDKTGEHTSKTPTNSNKLGDSSSDQDSKIDHPPTNSGERKAVSRRRGMAWANEHKCIAFYEASAKDGTNVDVAVNELCTYIIGKREEEA